MAESVGQDLQGSSVADPMWSEKQAGPRMRASLSLGHIKKDALGSFPENAMGSPGPKPRLLVGTQHQNQAELGGC